MDEKREVQETIVPLVPEQQQNNKASEEEFFNVLKMVAPGTNLRAALDGALRAGKGALIVVENEKVLPLIDGGFRVNCRFTPQRLIELTKMDGAIILSKDVKKINHANVLLTPDSKIKTSETGTRHKAAERTAKQTGTLVIAISERRNEIAVFYKNIRYPLRSTDVILRKVNEHIQAIEKQRELFDKHIERLNKLELKNYPSLHQAMQVVQKGKMILKISEELKKYITELGNEGILQKTRLKEISSGVERETNLVIKDYTRLDIKKSRILLDSLTYDEILDTENILRVLAYESARQIIPVKGWRILSKTTLQESDIATLVKQMGSLGKAIHSNIKEYSEVFGEERAQLFKEEVEKIKISF
jgi:diadenylate cyclase